MTKLKQILVVDDELDVLEVLAELLSDYADKVLVASTGAEALEILKTHKVDCIISDINMAPMNGIDFLNKIHECGECRNVPFFFYTAHGTEENMKFINSSYVRAVISKPSFDDLEKEIIKMMAC